MSLHRSQRETDPWPIPAPFGVLGLRAGGTGQGIDGIRRGWKGNGKKKLGMSNPKGGTSEKSPNHCNWGGGLEKKVTRSCPLWCLQQESGFIEKGVFEPKLVWLSG